VSADDALPRDSLLPALPLPARAVPAVHSQARGSLKGATACIARELSKSVQPNGSGRARTKTRGTSGAERARTGWPGSLATGLMGLALAPIAAPRAAIAVARVHAERAERLERTFAPLAWVAAVGIRWGRARVARAPASRAGRAQHLAPVGTRALARRLFRIALAPRTAPRPAVAKAPVGSEGVHCGKAPPTRGTQELALVVLFGHAVGAVPPSLVARAAQRLDPIRTGRSVVRLLL